jgi:proline-specific peptidase
MMLAEEAKRGEGYIDVGPGRVWYERAGEGTSLLLLHGGPGATSDYLLPLMALAEDGYRVVRYDQLGSDRSDKPNDLSLWQVPRFVAEVETVRQALGLGRMHLLGQSWGSFLALEYALHHQEHLRSLILYSGAASTRQCVDGMNAWRAQLPSETQAVLARYEATGETDHPEYLAAIDVLYRRHLCRLDPWPEVLAQALQRMALPVYNTMWGPNEFTCTGNLMGWDRRDRLGEIRVPTLILCGRYDEVMPECSETMHRGIASSELVIFANSSHLAHFEEPDRFFAVVRDFLRRAETGAAVVRT